MHCYDADTWRLPSFGGRIKATNSSFHLWDATDDFSDVAMDLLFEHDRLYLHNAKGLFGAVPMTMTGVLLCPVGQRGSPSCEVALPKNIELIKLAKLAGCIGVHRQNVHLSVNHVCHILMPARMM